MLMLHAAGCWLLYTSSSSAAAAESTSVAVLPYWRYYTLPSLALAIYPPASGDPDPRETPRERGSSALHRSLRTLLMSAEPPTLKLLMIGDSTVGKSWLLARYSSENKSLKLDSSLPTIGIDFKIKRISIDDQKVKLQIWCSSHK